MKSNDEPKKFNHIKSNSQNESDLELATGNRLFTHDDEKTKHHQNQNFDVESFLKARPEFSIKDTTSNPGPLGLFGFGLTTFLLNMHNAGVYPMSSVIFSMGLCYGGLAQIIAGIFEWHKNRTFTSVVFISYGLFWWSLIFVLIFSAVGVAPAPDDIGMGFYLFIWGVLSFGFLVASVKRPKVIFLVFLTVVLLFWLLAIEKWTNDPKVGKAAGIDGIICSILAIYAGMAELLNEAFGFTVLPMGAPKVIETKFKA